MPQSCEPRVNYSMGWFSIDGRASARRSFTRGERAGKACERTCPRKRVTGRHAALAIGLIAADQAVSLRPGGDAPLEPPVLNIALGQCIADIHHHHEDHSGEEMKQRNGLNGMA